MANTKLPQGLKILQFNIKGINSLNKGNELNNFILQSLQEEQDVATW